MGKTKPQPMMTTNHMIHINQRLTKKTKSILQSVNQVKKGNMHSGIKWHSPETTVANNLVNIMKTIHWQ